MVTVAQLVEPRIVIPVVVGSRPISHPTIANEETRQNGGFLRFCLVVSAPTGPYVRRQAHDRMDRSRPLLRTGCVADEVRLQDEIASLALCPRSGLTRARNIHRSRMSRVVRGSLR